MRYDAFISYRHLELDMYVAKQVHKRLETFKVPRSVAKKTGKKSIKRVFRDQEELPVGSNLGEDIRNALQESEYLIVICSPSTKESHWVQQEIDTFISMHGREHILAILIEGEPKDSFPEQLLINDKGETVEPLAADVRGKSKSEIKNKLKTELLRLAAKLLGCTFDDLRQRHRERRLKKYISVSAIIAVLALVFGGYSVYNAIMIQQNYEEKQINQSKYLADTALGILESGDRITAGLIALEALPTEDNDRPYVSKAHYALSQALNVYKDGNVIEKDRLLKHDLPVSKIAYSMDGKKLVSVDQGEYVYVWDVNDGTKLLQVTPEVGEGGKVNVVKNVALTEDKHLIIAGDRKISSLDMDGKEIWNITSENGILAFEVDMKLGIGVSVTHGRMDVIDLKTGKSLGGTENNDIIGNFSSEVAIDNQYKRIVVNYFPKEDVTAGYIKVYDMQTEASKDYATYNSYIMDVIFSNDGNIITLSGDWQEFQDYSRTKVDINIEKIDVDTGISQWVNTVDLKVLGMNTGTNILRTREYTDSSTEKKHDEVLLVANNMAYTWDATDGSIVSSITLTNDVAAFLVSSSSYHGYIVEKNGNVGVYNMTTGAYFGNISIGQEASVSEVLIQNGVIASSAYASPNVMLMKYHKGYGMETLESFDGSVSGMDYSSDEKYYVVTSINDENIEEYSFYKTKDKSLIGQWSYGVKSNIKFSGFINDNTFFIVDKNGKAVFYNVETEEEVNLEPEKSMIGVNCYITNNKKYAFVYEGFNGYYLLNMAEQKIQAEGKIDISLNTGILTEDGSRFYASTDDTNIIALDIKNGEIGYIEGDNYRVAADGVDKKALAVNADGSLLAVSCLDNMLRILDIKSNETVAELKFAGQNQSYLEFSPDGKKLIMQGDTYHFSVYDMEMQEYLYISSKQINSVQNIIYDDKSDTIGILTTVEMFILNEDDYEPLACIDNGIAYMPKNCLIYTAYTDTVYSFPYMDLDMLLEEAKRQFGDAKLTERERTQYNVD